MKIITKQEAAAWCTSHGMPIDKRGLPAVWDFEDSQHFKIPKDAGQRTALVKSHMEQLHVGADCLVWLDDWSVWPSGQWQHLFDRFRQSYGSQALLIEKPAHLIEKAEYDAAISIAVYSILMLWDCYVIAGHGNWVHYSHDEVGIIKTMG